MGDEYDGINYDPDNMMGDAYLGGDDDAFVGDDGDGDLLVADDDGDLLLLDDDPDGDAPGGDDEIDPLDDLENCWLTAKSAEPEEQPELLKALLVKEKDYYDNNKERTKFGFRATRLLLNLAHAEGKSAEVLKHFATLTTDYKQQLKDSRQPITVILEKLVDSPDIVKLCDSTLAITSDLKTRVKLMLLKARGLVKREDHSAEAEAEIHKILDVAHDLCKENGIDNVLHSSSLLDIYALKISFAEQKGNFKAQKSYFDRALPLTSAGLASNQVTGAIFRCGGRVRMHDCKYGEASQHFCEAFKNFDECRYTEGSDECLKLWVFSSLLSGSPVNPFDDHRAAGYLTKTPIKNIERLVRSSTAKNIDQFLKDKRPCLRDPVVADYVPHLERSIQKRYFLDLVKPYSNISLGFVAKNIVASELDTENLLVEMILDGQVQGRIDQTAGCLYLRPPPIAQDEYYDGLRAVSATIAKLQNSVLQAVS